jgi:hypothetical protein
LEVKIGEFEAEYRAAVTTAEENYDGFGTISLSEYYNTRGKDARLVLIRREHFDRQCTRYASGLHTPEAADKDLEEEIGRRAFERFLLGGVKV